MTLTPAQAANALRSSTQHVLSDMNKFTEQTFRTRGGRRGAGMGLLLEGLWGYHTSVRVESHGLEVGWIPDDQYNDYAILDRNLPWDETTRAGELLRVEAKSMNLGADEPKGHFAELRENMHDDDLLLVLVWTWSPTTASPDRVWPCVTDLFLDRAKPIADLRDALHVARGGTFVDRTRCPDGCLPEICQHHGEPLNANGKRERLQGPETCRVSRTVSFASNFGGLKRMLAAGSAQARAVKSTHLKGNPVAADFVEFMQRATAT